MITHKFQGLRRSMTHVVTRFVLNHYDNAVLYSNADSFNYPYFTGCREGKRPRGHIYRNRSHILGDTSRRNSHHLVFDADDPRPLYDVDVVLLEDQLDNNCWTIYRNPYATFSSRCQALHVGAPNKFLLPELFPVSEELLKSYCDLYWVHKQEGRLVVAEHITQPSHWSHLRELFGLPTRPTPRPTGFASSFGDTKGATTRASSLPHVVHSLLSRFAPYVLESEDLRKISVDSWGGYLEGPHWVPNT